MTVDEVSDLTKCYKPLKRWRILSTLIEDGLLEPKEYTTKEISIMLNMSEVGIKLVEHRAIENMRKIIESDDKYESLRYMF